MKIEIEGLAKLQQQLSALPQRGVKALGVALHNEGERIMADSKENYVPVDTGTLRGTGHVEKPEIQSGQVVVTLGYGGPAAPYALVQHERMDFEHTVGQAKYLERPALAAAATAGKRITADVKEELK